MTPVSAQAVADDIALQHTVKFVQAVLSEAQTALATLEIPKNDVFPYLSGVQELLKSKDWQMLTGSYCANDAGLDSGPRKILTSMYMEYLEGSRSRCAMLTVIN